MERRLVQIVRFGLFLLALTVLAALPSVRAYAAPYAAMVMDARTGEVLHSRNADTRLHPASLTKMMTLYIAFEAIENGEISLDTPVKISSKSANEPPSKLGLRAGQTIKLRYLIRAAAVKSANDAATAIGEAIEGSEAAFARRMNRTAQALGMTRSTFKNAHGLTESGHLSTARDMTLLGRHLFFDYPEYYNLFSRTSTNAGIREVANTNRRFLASYRGADGIKTGYTGAAGFNLVASAERGQQRIITTVFGGVSSSARNAKVAELMDMGFRRAPQTASVVQPRKPVYEEPDGDVILNVVRAVPASPRPLPRPGSKPAELPPELLMALAADIEEAISGLQGGTGFAAPAAAPVPRPRPTTLMLASLYTEPDQASQSDQMPEIVTRLSTSGGRHWGVNVGHFNTRYEAERILLKTALSELGTLDEALRKVVKSSQGYEANFVGLTEDMAGLACRRLIARGVACETLSPG